MRADVRLAVQLREVEVVEDEREAERRRAQLERAERRRRQHDEGEEGDAARRHRAHRERRRRDKAKSLARRLAVAAVVGERQARRGEVGVEPDERRERARDREADEDAEREENGFDRHEICASKGFL